MQGGHEVSGFSHYRFRKLVICQRVYTKHVFVANLYEMTNRNTRNKETGLQIAKVDTAGWLLFFF